MAITYRSTGAISNSTATPLVPGMPAGWAAGDLLILRVGTKAATPPTVTTPSGWTAPSNNVSTGGAGTAGADAGPVLATVLYRVAQAGDTAPSVALSAAASPGSAQIDAYTPGAGETWDPPVTAVAGDTTGNTTLYDPPVAAITIALAAGDWIAAFDFINGDLGTATVPGTLTIAGITLGTGANRSNFSSTTGNQARIVTNDWPVTAGTATAGPDRSMSYSAPGSASMSGASVFYRLRLAAAAADPHKGQVIISRQAVHRASRW